MDEEYPKRRKVLNYTTAFEWFSIHTVDDSRRNFLGAIRVP